MTETSTKTPSEELLWDLKVTSQARFAAARRLAGAEAGFTRLTALTSAYLIVLTVVGRFVDLPSVVQNRIDLIGVALSIVILASSLLQNASGNGVKSDQLHRSAMSIDKMRGDLEAEGELALDRILSLRNEYNNLKHIYAVNHIGMDFKQVVVDRPHDFSWAKAHSLFFMWLEIKINNSIANVFLIGVTVLVAWVVFGYALPSATG